MQHEDKALDRLDGHDRGDGTDPDGGAGTKRRLERQGGAIGHAVDGRGIAD